jgi:hypothetical protein
LRGEKWQFCFLSLQLLKVYIRVLWSSFGRFVLFLQQIGYFLSALPDAVLEGSKRFLIMYNDKKD